MRGNITSYNVPLTILEYFNPTAIINCSRDSNYYTSSIINVDANYPSLNNLNTIDIKFRIKKTTEVNWGNWTSLSDSTDYSFNADNQYAWDLEVYLEDILGTTKTYTINKALDVGIPIVFYDIDRRSVGINCLPIGNETIEVNGVNVLPFELYYDANGSNTSVLLSESAANYRYLEIFFRSNDGTNNKSSIKVENPNGAIVSLDYTWVLGSVYIKHSNATITNDTITLSNGTQINLSNNNVSIEAQDYIYIYKVNGYK